MTVPMSGGKRKDRGQDNDQTKHIGPLPQFPQPAYPVCRKLTNPPLPPSSPRSSLEQWSPTFSAPETIFIEDKFSTDHGKWGGWSQDDSNVLHLLCTLFLL